MSQRELMVAAKTKVARRSGLRTRPPEGRELFWQKVYSPVYYRLPLVMREKVVAAMPGSHRRTWHTPAQVGGPAASLLGPWPEVASSAPSSSPSNASQAS